MAEVILSGAVRNNLLSLQNTASLLENTQSRLATGLAVNSALDDPAAFFTASSLSSRAGDLSRLLDDVGLAVQTLEAADTGLSAITDLVEAAQASARNALQAPAATATAATTTGTGISLSADAAATVTGSGLVDPADLVGGGNGISEGETLTIDSGAGAVTFTFNATPSGTNSVNTLDTLVTAINDGTNGVANVTASNVGGQLVLTGDDNETNFTVGGTIDAASDFGIAEQAFNATNLLSQGFVQGETLTVNVGGAGVQTITFGTGGSEVSTLAELDTALSGLTGVTASQTTGNLTLTALNNTDSIVVGGNTGTQLGLASDTPTIAPTAGGTPNATRTAAETEFNNLLTQINQLASDASFNGNNLLAGDNLTAIFNEDGSSTLSVTGVNFNSTGLGISTAATNAFQTDSNIDATLTELDTAISTLRTQASTFGSNLSVVQVRQDFTESLINTLESGAAGLTLADSNEEAANVTALQTRQSFSTSTLSLAARADQAALQLLR